MFNVRRFIKILNISDYLKDIFMLRLVAKNIKKKAPELSDAFFILHLSIKTYG